MPLVAAQINLKNQLPTFEISNATFIVDGVTFPAVNNIGTGYDVSVMANISQKNLANIDLTFSFENSNEITGATLTNTSQTIAGTVTHTGIVYTITFAGANLTIENQNIILT